LSHTSSLCSSGHFGGGGLKNYLPGLLWTIILLISASQVARIIGESHWNTQELSVWSPSYRKIKNKRMEKYTRHIWREEITGSTFNIKANRI
jgi:hypothetical protein